MFESVRSKFLIKTGSYGLTCCLVITLANSLLFAVSNGRHHQPAAQISSEGLVINSLMFVLAWFFFVKGRRKNREESLVAIILMVFVHYFFVSNVMTALDV